MFATCMVYGLQEIPVCYGGVDGDGSRGIEIHSTWTELGTACPERGRGGPVDSRQVGQERAARVRLAQIAGEISRFHFAQRVPIRLLRARLFGEREAGRTNGHK